MKKIINKATIITGLLLGFVNFGSSQSLTDLIETALANNYQIKILKNSSTILSNNDSWGNAGLLPTVSLDAGASTALNSTRQEFSSGASQEGQNAQTSNLNLSLLANWTAFDGFGVYARKDKLAYLNQQGELSTKFYIEQTVSDLVTAYYQLIYETGLLENYEGSLEISRYRLNLEKQRKKVGAGTSMTYNQALVDYHSDSIQWLAQSNRIQTFNIELNRLLNTDLSTEFSPEEQEFAFKILPSKDSILQQIGQANYQISAAQLDELIAEAEVKVQQANRYPKLDLYGGYQIAQSNAEVGFISLNRNLGPVIGLNLSFNLYNGGNVNRAVANAALEEENAQLTKSDLTLNLQAQALTLYQQYQSILQQISLSEQNVSAMESVVETATQQLAKGAISGYEFRLVQLSLINAQSSLLGQKFALKAAEIGLNRLIGQVLSVYL